MNENLNPYAPPVEFECEPRQGQPKQSVEQIYWDHVRSLGPTERIRAALRLNSNVRTMIQNQIKSKSPEISDQTLKFAVARRFYWDEPNVLKLLDQAEHSQREKESENE